MSAYLKGARAAVIVLADTNTELRTVESNQFKNGQEARVNGPLYYRWDSTSMATDDDDAVLKPNDKTSLQAGRWIGYVRIVRRGIESIPLAALVLANDVDATSIIATEAHPSIGFEGSVWSSGALIRGSWLFGGDGKLNMAFSFKKDADQYVDVGAFTTDGDLLVGRAVKASTLDARDFQTLVIGSDKGNTSSIAFQKNVNLDGAQLTNKYVTPTWNASTIQLAFDEGNKWHIAMQANLAQLTCTQNNDGGTYFVAIDQDATGNRTVVWDNSAFYFKAPADKVLSVTPDTRDIFVFECLPGHGLFCLVFVKGLPIP